MRTLPPPTDDELAALQTLLDASVRTATKSVAVSVAYGPRQMTAAETVAAWRAARIAAMTTVGPNGQPHTAPVHADLRGATLHTVIYEDAVRRRDLATNPRVAFTTWHEGAVVVCYGRAREVAGSLRDARPAQSGDPRRVVALEVRLTRIYAMRAPERREPAAPPS